MAIKKIIWSSRAKNTLFSILDFYAERNGSTDYSEKLFTKIQETIHLISQQPLIGKRTNKEDIRFIVVFDYMIFYSTTDSSIEILLIWDSRQSPSKIASFKRIQ